MVAPVTEKPSYEMLVAFQDMCVSYMQEIDVLEEFTASMNPGEALVSYGVSDYFAEKWTPEQQQADFTQALYDTAQRLGIDLPTAPEGDDDDSV